MAVAWNKNQCAISRVFHSVLCGGPEKGQWLGEKVFKLALHGYGGPTGCPWA